MLHKQVADEKISLKTILSFVYYHLALGFNMMCLHVHLIFRIVLNSKIFLYRSAIDVDICYEVYCMHVITLSLLANQKTYYVMIASIFYVKAHCTYDCQIPKRHFTQQQKQSKDNINGDSSLLKTICCHLDFSSQFLSLWIHSTDSL